MSKPILNIKIIGTFMICLSSCLTDSENTSNHLQQEIEDGVLENLFQTDRSPCSDEENIIMMAVDTGNYGVVMKYLKNGGDPILECECNKNSHYDCTYTRLSFYMEDCDSIEYVKYYLSLDIPQSVKDEFFHHYLVLENDVMTDYMIEIGAHLDDHYICFPTTLPRITKAIELGYDINSQDSKNGWTLLMQFAFCENEEYVDCKIEGIEYLISQSARLDIKNKEGKTALDIATNEKIKAYLMSLED
jgi:ankyrin repeat protein